MLEKLFDRFFPEQTAESIYEIDFERLYEAGIKCIIFDLDNTIAPYDVPEPDEKMVGFLNKLTEQGFKLCLLSNNGEARVARFNERLGLYAVCKAKKPGRTGIGKALALMGGNTQNAALVGDQVLTDIWCGNRAGLLTILVKPASDRDEWTVRLKRPIEKILLWYYKKNAV